MEGRLLDFIALGVLIFVVLMIIYGVIFIHDIPYEIAKKRKHPHQDAIHTAGWVSLFLMHTIWPFLWIWATLYKPDMGWGFQAKQDATPALKPPPPTDTEALQQRIATLEQQREEMQRNHNLHIQELSKRLFKLEQKAMKEGEN